MTSIFGSASDLHPAELFKNSQNNQWLMKLYARLTHRANTFLFLYSLGCSLVTVYRFVSAPALSFLDLLLLVLSPAAVPFLAFGAIKGQPCSPRLQLLLASFFSLVLQEQVRCCSLGESAT